MPEDEFARRGINLRLHGIIHFLNSSQNIAFSFFRTEAVLLDVDFGIAFAYFWKRISFLGVLVADSRKQIFQDYLLAQSYNFV